MPGQVCGHEVGAWSPALPRGTPGLVKKDCALWGAGGNDVADFL